MPFDQYQAHPLPNPVAEVEGDSVRLRESYYGGTTLIISIPEWVDLVKRVALALERAKKVSPAKV
jgi:hypothetical protein